MISAVIAMAGCDASDSKGKPSMNQRQDQAIADPMNYKVDFSDKDANRNGISDFDRDGFNRDLKSVFNP